MTLKQILALIHAIPDVVEIIEDAKPVIEAAKKVAPTVIPIIEDLAKQEGSTPEAVATAIFAPQRMSAEDEAKWFDAQNDDG